MNPLQALLEAKSAEFDEEFIFAMWKVGDGRKEHLKTILRSYLKEAFLAGVEASEGCVPQGRKAQEAGSLENMVSTGFNVCRKETLSSLQKLKEEVTETKV